MPVFSRVAAPPPPSWEPIFTMVGACMEALKVLLEPLCGRGEEDWRDGGERTVRRGEGGRIASREKLHKCHKEAAAIGGLPPGARAAATTRRRERRGFEGADANTRLR